MGFRRLAVVAGLVVATVGCAPAPPSSIPEPSPSVGGGGSRCQGLDLRAPDGARVDLTGTWQGVGLWLVTQSGSCVVIEGFSQISGRRIGEEYRLVFTGNLESDFSIVGLWMWTWASTARPDLARGETSSVELRVEFDSEGQPILGVPWQSVIGEPAYTVTLERISLSTELPES